MDPFTIAGAGASLFGSTMSFIDGIRAKKAQKRAEKEATKALAAAKRAISTNYLEAAQLPIDAYENEFRANTANNRQALEALSEGGQRAAAAGVGRVSLNAANVNESIRERMQRDVFALDLMKRKEDARIAGALGEISLAEAEGAQVAAANREQQAAAAFTNAVGGIGDTGLTILKNAPLYANNTDEEAAA